MSHLGLTPAAIDAMPAHDVFALLDYWQAHPPAAEILAAVYRVVPSPVPDPDDPSGIGALIGRGIGSASNPNASKLNVVLGTLAND